MRYDSRSFLFQVFMPFGGVADTTPPVFCPTAICPSIRFLETSGSIFPLSLDHSINLRPQYCPLRGHFLDSMNYVTGSGAIILPSLLSNWRRPRSRNPDLPPFPDEFCRRNRTSYADVALSPRKRPRFQHCRNRFSLFSPLHPLFFRTSGRKGLVVRSVATFFESFLAVFRDLSRQIADD